MPLDVVRCRVHEGPLRSCFSAMAMRMLCTRLSRAEPGGGLGCSKPGAGITTGMTGPRAEAVGVYWVTKGALLGRGNSLCAPAPSPASSAARGRRPADLRLWRSPAAAESGGGGEPLRLAAMLPPGEDKALPRWTRRWRDTLASRRSRSDSCSVTLLLWWVRSLVLCTLPSASPSSPPLTLVPSSVGSSKAPGESPTSRAADTCCR